MMEIPLMRLPKLRSHVPCIKKSVLGQASNILLKEAMTNLLQSLLHPNHSMKEVLNGLWKFAQTIAGD